MEESLRWALKFMEKKASDLTGHRAEAGELKSIGGRMMASVTVRGRTRKELPNPNPGRNPGPNPNGVFIS